jgi:L-asparaginase
MKIGRSKICLLINGSIPNLRAKNLAQWLAQLPELNIIAEVEPILISNKPSTELAPDVWLKLAQEIYRRLKKFDGFVVLHDLDNVLYTGAALSFLIKNLNKPIIITGGPALQNHQNELETKANLINAAQVASSAINEVGLIFGNRLLRANQAEQELPLSLNKFSASENGILGRVDFSLRIFEHSAQKSSGRTSLSNKLNPDVVTIAIQPNLNAKTLHQQIGKSAGAVIDASAYEHIPERLQTLLGTIGHQTVVVLWWPGQLQPHLTPKNIIVVTDMTLPTTVVKLMWALGQTDATKKIKQLLQQNIAGELL